VSAALETGPFFHGTAAALAPGDVLTPGRPSNYRQGLVMNHVYFTAVKDNAGLSAEIAVELVGGEPHVYEVEPTGPFEDDPNVTDKKLPGNPTRSFRSLEPVRIVAEVDDWTRLTPEALQTWRERLAALSASRAEIIN
jgi:hypothetical protein